MEDRIENIRRVLHQIKPSFRLQGEFERIAHGDVVPALANRVLLRQVGVDANEDLGRRSHTDAHYAAESGFTATELQYH